MTECDLWAEFYDVVHQGLEGEAEFYVGHAARKGGRALELGCGTGRLALPMCMSGCDVTGVDNSKAMLALCREKKRALGKTKGKLRLVLANMVSLDLGMEYDFVAMAYRTFMHVLTPEDQRSCLRAVRRHMKDDGLFMLNVWAPTPSTLAAITARGQGTLRLVDRYPAAEGRGVLCHYASQRCDEFRQMLIEEHLIQELAPDGTLVRAVSLPLTRAWITHREMRALLECCGFEAQALFGDFECRPFTESSTEMIWVLRKGTRAA